MADDTLPIAGYLLTRAPAAVWEPFEVRHKWVQAEHVATVYKDTAESIEPMVSADTVRRLLAERDARIRVLTEALQQIRALDYRNAATNRAAYDAHNIAATALEARNG